MVDETMAQEEGLTFDVYKEEEAKPPGEEQPPPAEGEQSDPKEEKEEALPKYVYVREVVREPRMHFYRVPQLGSYLAIKLEYNSCLYEEAVDAAIANHMEIRAKIEEQEKEKKEFHDKQ